MTGRKGIGSEVHGQMSIEFSAPVKRPCSGNYCNVFNRNVVINVHQYRDLIVYRSEQCRRVS